MDVKKEKAQLLFEIGTEEMPPSCVDEGLSGLKKTLGQKLVENRLKFDEIQTYSSPRRLVAIVGGLRKIQESEEKIITGPPVGIALDDKGEPTKAAVGFARSLGLKAGELEKIRVKGKGLYLGKKIVEEGKKTIDLLPAVLRDSILSLNFSKQMSWADYSIKFIRPIRWIAAIYDNKVIDFKIAGLNSSDVTYGHRTISPQPITIKDTGDYFKILENKGKVVADAEKRKKMILNQIKNLEENKWNGRFRVVLDEDLLKDVVNLVEIPNVIVGNFPEEFLYIPEALLIEAVQHHQKYFAVLDDSGKVSTSFIIVQNGIKDNGEIKKGNERVLKARLNDAAYFYEEDRKHNFNYWTDKLKGVIFFSGLGSIYDKTVRLKKITAFIVKLLKEAEGAGNSDLSENLSRASMLCKCDLVTNMVVEFPSLQGIVGCRYAEEKGEKKEVSSAIFEHYLPRFAGDILPATETGLILSVADKIDTITGMFLAGEIPTGSQDPFALRRKASGIVQSLLKGGYDFSLDDLIKYNLKLYFEYPHFKYKKDPAIADTIGDFIMARFKFMLEKKNKKIDILEAVLGSGCSSIPDIRLRYDAIEKFINKKDVKRIYYPMVRCRNIIGKASSGSVDNKLLVEEYEKKLYSSAEKKKALVKELIRSKDYRKVLEQLYGFGQIVDEFFDEVLVMDRDKKIKDNRINLIKQVVGIYLTMADFSKLDIDSNNK